VCRNRCKNKFKVKAVDIVCYQMGLDMKKYSLYQVKRVMLIPWERAVT